MRCRPSSGRPLGAHPPACRPPPPGLARCPPGPPDPSLGYFVCPGIFCRQRLHSLLLHTSWISVSLSTSQGNLTSVPESTSVPARPPHATVPQPVFWSRLVTSCVKSFCRLLCALTVGFPVRRKVGPVLCPSCVWAPDAHLTLVRPPCLSRD